MSTPDLPSQLTFHGNGGTFPPYGKITEDDHGPVVVTFSWIFYCLTGLALLTRLATRRSWTADSFLLIIAWILLTGESVAIHQAASSGLGRRFASLTGDAYARSGQAFYASQMLKILVLAVTKMSYIFIFKRLISTSLDRMRHMVGIFHALLAIFAAWGVGTVFAFAFQCQLPSPWDSAQRATCVNRPILYYITGIINMVTDLAIVAIPAVIVWNVRLKSHERWTIIAIFATRILTVIASGIELGYMGDYLWGSDPTWMNESPTIWGQAMVNLSVTTACIPLMKPFLDMLQFSLLDTSTLPFTAQAGAYYGSHRDTSPLWSREKHGGTSSSDEGGRRSDRTLQQQQQHQQRSWRVAQDPPRASWKQQREQERQQRKYQQQRKQEQKLQQQRKKQRGGLTQQQPPPPPPHSQFAPTTQSPADKYVPTGYSPHNSVTASVVDYSRPPIVESRMGMGQVSDPRW